MSWQIKPSGRTAVGAPSLPPPTSASAALLLVLRGPEKGREVALGEEPVEIGREGCTLTIAHHLVSRRHARIERVGAGFLLRDLGSTNGTYLNDVRVSEQTLREGDQITVGKSVLKFMTLANPDVRHLRQIFEDAHRDALTGIHNKRYFDQAFADAVRDAHARGEPLCLVLFDIDHFKSVNDNHGHVAGDQVLKRVAAVVSSQVREQDVLARVGGEEFALLLPRTARSVATSAAEIIRGTVEMTDVDLDGGRITVTLSVGVGELARDESAEALYRKTDEKLYEAKRAGRNRVC